MFVTSNSQEYFPKDLFIICSMAGAHSHAYHKVIRECTFDEYAVEHKEFLKAHGTIESYRYEAQITGRKFYEVEDTPIFINKIITEEQVDLNNMESITEEIQ